LSSVIEQWIGTDLIAVRELGEEIAVL
jgi:hypothetical protein